MIHALISSSTNIFSFIWFGTLSIIESDTHTYSQANTWTDTQSNLMISSGQCHFPFHSSTHTKIVSRSFHFLSFVFYIYMSVSVQYIISRHLVFVFAFFYNHSYLLKSVRSFEDNFVHIHTFTWQAVPILNFWCPSLRTAVATVAALTTQVFLKLQQLTHECEIGWNVWLASLDMLIRLVQTKSFVGHEVRHCDGDRTTDAS